MLAASAGRISLSAAIRWVAPCDSSRRVRPSTSRHSTTWVWPRRRRPFAGSWIATRESTQSRLRACSIATSYTVPGAPVLGIGTSAVEHLPDDQRLGRPLLEPAHVEQAGRVDLPAVDVRHPGHRHEDPATAEHLGHQAEHARLVDLGPDGHHEVADLADLVALGVEDRQPDEAGHVDAGGGRAHVPRRYRAPGPRRGSRSGPAPWNAGPAARIRGRPRVPGPPRRCGAR